MKCSLESEIGKAFIGTRSKAIQKVTLPPSRDIPFYGPVFTNPTCDTLKCPSRLRNHPRKWRSACPRSRPTDGGSDVFATRDGETLGEGNAELLHRARRGVPRSSQRTTRWWMICSASPCTLSVRP